MKIPEEILTRGLAGLIGMRFTETEPDRCVVEYKVTPELHQPFGILHGGVHCAVVESAASIGAQVWLGERGRIVGVNNTTDFLRPVSEGTLRAVATPIHRGRTQQLWQVEITREDGVLVARGQVRLANLLNEPPVPPDPAAS
jgi:uncharacterized protein (TIGR00369 family)